VAGLPRPWKITAKRRLKSGPDYHRSIVFAVLPELVGNRGIVGPELPLLTPSDRRSSQKSMAFGALVVFLPDGRLETRNRRGVRGDWLRGDGLELGDGRR
jgi:hypothetical protein